MPNKKPIKKIFESASIESADVNDELTESVQAEASSEETSATTHPQEEESESSVEKETPVQEDSRSSDEETSPEDLLEDVRRSLIEAEGEKEQKDSKWWQRLGRKAKKVESQESPSLEEIDLPSMSFSTEPVESEQLKNESDQEVEEIDDLIDLLKAESEEQTVESVAPPETEPAPEPEPEIDFEELKKQAFRPREEGEEPEELTDVRSIALEGGEEVLVEVDTKAPDPWEERLKAFENALKPYRTYINIALAVFGVVVAVIASLIIFNVYQRSRPEPVKQVSNLPYPTGVSLPGGWSFQLGKGTVQNGEWNPRGAEWLEGTEVCRWVALPWSLQLEAVIRTLNPKDPIDLVMSNNDKLVYQVTSVKQLTPEQLQKVDSNSPCLLLILTQPDAQKRWVLTALP